MDFETYKSSHLRNAGGWYSRAGRPASTAPLKEEWETIARALLC
jgi:hypothetical protein